MCASAAAAALKLEPTNLSVHAALGALEEKQLPASAVGTPQQQSSAASLQQQQKEEEDAVQEEQASATSSSAELPSSPAPSEPPVAEKEQADRERLLLKWHGATRNLLVGCIKPTSAAGIHKGALGGANTASSLHIAAMALARWKFYKPHVAEDREVSLAKQIKQAESISSSHSSFDLPALTFLSPCCCDAAAASGFSLASIW